MALASLLWSAIAVSALNLPTSHPQNITQTLDHFQSPSFHQATFAQRYWLVDDFWDSSSPIFLYLCGQHACSGLDPAYLYPFQVAKRLHALFISVEHRFYGQSFPPSISSLQPALPTALEVNQALGDLSELVLTLKREKQLWGNKWIVIGGGYAGALAAWFRTKYPGLVDGAWASSALVNPVLDYWEFDKQVYQSLLKSGLQCAEAVQSLTAYATRLYEGGDVEMISEAFKAAAEFRNDSDQRTVLWMLGDAVSSLVVAGYRSELCENALAEDPFRTLQIVANLSHVNITQKYNLLSPADYSSTANQNRTRIDGARPAHWQRCAQLGLFPTPGNYSIRSRLLTLPFYSSFCATIFPYSAHLTPNLPLVLSHLGTRILYTSGEEDPWQWAGYRGESKPGQEIYSEKIECKDCSHCVDLKTPRKGDPAELKAARKSIEERVQSWVTKG